jgi:hypothetical protein
MGSSLISQSTRFHIVGNLPDFCLANFSESHTVCHMKKGGACGTACKHSVCALEDPSKASFLENATYVMV